MAQVVPEKTVIDEANPRERFYNSLHDARVLDARAAIQAGLYINGLAVTATLAFLGNISPKIDPAHPVHAHPPRAFVYSLGLFGFGVLCAATAAALSYLANHQYAEAESPFQKSDQQRWRHGWNARIAHLAGYGACAGMLLAFIFGVTAAVIGFDHL